MFNPLATLLYATALATATLAQTISLSILTPAITGTFTAGQCILVQIERYSPPSDTIVEVGLATASLECPAGCEDPTQALGTLLYTGPYQPQPPLAEHTYENVTVTVPGWYNGPAQLVAARFYVQGVYAVPNLEYATTNFTVVGGAG